ncbi:MULTISPECIES: hypothetical protein [Bacillus cereus group]|uniref:HD domain-containing protein n=1 Tax=Bacillus thuringiensis TaxID=1428 RepID=A0A9X7ATJ3_BACTU|nr:MULTISPECIES: hypothetical protein [Bacillus cereus group]PEV64195.1 hypothetical protein CN434_25640 [Bacillus thuringiensis]PFT50778.1 hypothetical protein COK72_01885 [Bacillus thuringiensis]PFY22815.1 hypothetical protein COL44_18205 [Bacillus toyonensis]
MDDIIMMANQQITEDDLYPLTEENIALFNEKGYKLPTREELKRDAESQDLSIDDFYLCDKIFEPFCYCKFPVYFGTTSLKEVFGLHGMTPLKKHIEWLEAHANKLLHEKKDYFGFLTFTNTHVKFMFMNKMYWDVPVEDRYELFIEFYTHEDYGHHLIDRKLIQDAVKHQQTAYKDEMLSRLNDTLSNVGTDEMITIYRGCGDKSTAPTESMSWTLSLDTAIFFAMRRGLDGDIYEAKVKKEHVIDYLQGRNEEEILAFPQHVEDIKPYNMIKTNEEIRAMLDDEYAEEYHLYKNTFILDKYFDNPEGIHGTLHCKRVLFHALSLSRALNLNMRDRGILCNVACFHDIGRENDDEDREHGKLSVLKHHEEISGSFPYTCIDVVNREDTSEEYELHHMTDDEVDIIEFIMEYHCIGDEESKDALHNLNWDNEKTERAWNLYVIFKDADGLDRVRIKDLDTKYLRTAEAKNRVLFAYGLLKGIK